MSGSPRILVTLCTYNERSNLETLIPAIHERVPEADILVIDDNSPDGTGSYVDELAAKDQRIRIIHRPGKLGLGTATVAGFRYGIDNRYDFLINMDADWSHSPHYIPDLLARREEVDVVIGSRYIGGGGVQNWPLIRKVISHGLNLYTRAVLGLTTRDNTGSFRCYRVSTLAKIDWSNALARGYAIEEEILFRLKRIGATMTEVPITFEDRKHGSTKLKWNEGFIVAWNLLHLRLQSAMKGRGDSQSRQG
jgi:dolichol-phosphate mannosyltransferase